MSRTIKKIFSYDKITRLTSCQSTNDYILDKVKTEHLSEGSVIVTENQLAGKGQRGNSWESAPGQNLTFSLLLKPEFLPVNKQFYLTVITSIALYELIYPLLDSRIKIKWPNDIFIDNKKVCGVLIQNTLKGSQFGNSVIGIGLNVNQEQFRTLQATSLHLDKGNNFDKEILLHRFLYFFEKYYKKLKKGEYSYLLESYNEKLFQKDEMHLYEYDGLRFQGVITNVNENGFLCLSSGGKIKEFDLKEMKFIID